MRVVGTIFYVIDGRDKDELILQCTPTDNRSFYKYLFNTVKKDAGYGEEDLTKASTNMIMFLQCVLKVYYDKPTSLYKKISREKCRTIS